MDTRTLQKLTICGFLAVAMLTTRQLNAQNLTLEGQTGGFLTPTAYVVYSAKGQTFSHPAVGYHFIDAAKVIGDIQTFSITEGFASRGEVGYTRSVHTLGDSTDPTQGAFSNLWNFDGMNVFHGKVVGIKDGQFGPWTPGIAVGGVVRTGDKFVSGALVQQIAALQGAVVPAKSYTNGDVYIAFTKTWAKPPVPFLLNLGWKSTNATIFGIGGQSTRTVLRRSGHSAARLARNRGRALGGIHPGTAHVSQPGRNHSDRRAVQRSPSANDPGLRRARDAEGTSALCLRYRHRPGGRDDRHRCAPNRVAPALSSHFRPSGES